MPRFRRNDSYFDAWRFLPQELARVGRRRPDNRISWATRARGRIMTLYRVDGEITREAHAYIEADNEDDARDLFERLHCEINATGRIIFVAAEQVKIADK